MKRICKSYEFNFTICSVETTSITGPLHINANFMSKNKFYSPQFKRADAGSYLEKCKGSYKSNIEYIKKMENSKKLAIFVVPDKKMKTLRILSSTDQGH